MHIFRCSGPSAYHFSRWRLDFWCRPDSQVVLDLSDCTCIGDVSLGGLMPEAYDKLDCRRGMKPAAVPGLASLRLSGCSSLSHEGFEILSMHTTLSSTRELALNHVNALSLTSLQSYGREQLSPLPAMLACGGASLRVLRLDGSHVSHECLECIASNCLELIDLSLIACTGVQDQGLKSLASKCSKLLVLAVGGSRGRWTERHGLGAFHGLQCLCISRRSSCSDEDLAHVLHQHPTLEGIRLAGCPSISDASIAALPKTLQHAVFICCDRITGSGFERLTQLQGLRFRDCPHVTQEALQVSSHIFSFVPACIILWNSLIFSEELSHIYCWPAPVLKQNLQNNADLDVLEETHPLHGIIMALCIPMCTCVNKQ